MTEAKIWPQTIIRRSKLSKDGSHFWVFWIMSPYDGHSKMCFFYK